MASASLEPPKDRDFALGLGPVVVTPDEESLPGGFDWDAAVALAARNTVLYPGDVLAGPAAEPLSVEDGHVEIEIEGVGTLEQRVVG